MFSGILLLPVLGLENVTGQLFRPVIILFYYYMMVTFDFIPATTGHFLKFYTPMIDAMVFKENFPYSDWSCCRVWWNKFCRKQNHRENKLGYHTSGLSG